jgi:hypothetical protein
LITCGVSDAAQCVRPGPLLRQLGGNLRAQLGAHDHRRLVIDLHGFDPVERELGAAILAEQADRIGTTLAAVPHHVHVACAGILQSLEFGRLRAALAHHAVEGAVPGLGDQRHDVVQEGSLGLDDLRHLRQMGIIDAGESAPSSP